eukprot:10790030-Karenia_brevis.AAC.1
MPATIATYGIQKHQTIEQTGGLLGGGKGGWHKGKQQEAQETAKEWEQQMNEIITEQGDRQVLEAPEGTRINCNIWLQIPE